MLPMPTKRAKKKRSFGKGGKNPTVNNPDTHHGMYDLPNASVRSYSDKAKPMKFAEGGLTKKVAGYFAKQGNKSLAAHEYREAAGKEEDTPSIAKREEKALKNAPADMKNYEKKEHKAMGMNKGGMACGGMKKYAKGGAVRGGGCASKGTGKGTMR